AYAIAGVGVEHAFEAARIHFCADIESLPRNARACGCFAAARFDFLGQAAHPRLAADRSTPFIARLGLQTGRFVLRQRRAVCITREELGKVHALEHAGGILEAAVLRRGIADLRNPVGVDIAHADAAEGRVAAQEGAARADAEQGRAGWDRI